MDACNQFGYRVHCGPNGDAVIGHQREQGLPTPNFVGDVYGSRRERFQFEIALEIKAANPPRQFGTDFAGVAELNLPLDNLREVRISEKAERCARLVIEVGGTFLKPLPRVLNESNVQATEPGR